MYLTIHQYINLSIYLAGGRVAGWVRGGGRGVERGGALLGVEPHHPQQDRKHRHHQGQTRGPKVYRYQEQTWGLITMYINMNTYYNPATLGQYYSRLFL